MAGNFLATLWHSSQQFFSILRAQSGQAYMRCREQCYNSVVWVIPPSVALLRYCPECPSTDTQDWQALLTRCARWYSARVRITRKPGTLRKRSKFSLMRLSAGFKNFALFLVYESYEISRRRNQNLKITTKATKFLGDLEITTKSEILRWTNHTNPETLSPTNSHHETFSKFLAVLGLPKILAILEGSEQIFPRKRSLGAPVIFESWSTETFFICFKKGLSPSAKPNR